jgi:hypothetical protein
MSFFLNKGSFLNRGTAAFQLRDLAVTTYDWSPLWRSTFSVAACCTYMQRLVRGLCPHLAGLLKFLAHREIDLQATGPPAALVHLSTRARSLVDPKFPVNPIDKLVRRLVIRSVAGPQQHTVAQQDPRRPGLRHLFLPFSISQPSSAQSATRRNRPKHPPSLSGPRWFVWV